MVSFLCSPDYLIPVQTQKTYTETGVERVRGPKSSDEMSSLSLRNSSTSVTRKTVDRPGLYVDTGNYFLSRKKNLDPRPEETTFGKVLAGYR